MGIDARMLVRVQGTPSEEQLKLWSWDLARSIGADKFLLDRKIGRGAISKTEGWKEAEIPGTIYHQDGPDIKAFPGESLLEVHLWTRYYGEGYERGDILTICAVAEWCEQNIANCEVWYGGDSSGVCAEPFPDWKRREFRRLLYSSSGRNYFDYRGWDLESDPKPDLSECKLCVPDRGPRQFGGGGGGLYAAWCCAGCGLSIETHDGGKTWKEQK